ncbi:BadM/Rrf2 family transcriptional regulator [Peptoniphilus sp. ING2-D1G]|nr:BadM/Rrf2 family transcriptional regulator [Peptoniphilus sp. ING2-D1G]
MRITQETDYAFRILRHLATNEGKVVRAPKISEAEYVPKRFTLRILRKLNLAGITDAKRGANGGFFLKKPKEEITLYDVILAIEGPIVINRCQDPDDPYCSKNCALGRNFSTCRFHNELGKIQSNIIDMFKNLTISNFISA